MSNRDYFRGIEDPISGIFNLAEEISSKSERILTNSKFATVFVYFGLFLVFIFMLTFLLSGQFFLALIFVAMFITGIMTAKLMITLRSFLKKVTFRYLAIMAMKEGSPFAKIPRGKSMSERFMKYLRKKNRSFRGLLKKRPEVLRKDGYLVGMGGRRYHFDRFVIMKPSPLHRFFKIGYPGYSMFVREYPNPPSKEDLERLKKELREFYARSKIYPNRVVMLFRAGDDYSGLEEELYEKLVNGEVRLGGSGRRLNIQAVGELEEGNYEFVPFIPEIPRMLP